MLERGRALRYREDEREGCSAEEVRRGEIGMCTEVCERVVRAVEVDGGFGFLPLLVCRLLLDSVQFAVGGELGDREQMAAAAPTSQSSHPLNSIRTTLCYWGAFQSSS
jgi:hypothetical protein